HSAFCAAPVFEIVNFFEKEILMGQGSLFFASVLETLRYMAKTKLGQRCSFAVSEVLFFGQPGLQLVSWLSQIDLNN
ncbi:MAG: hypothetical protein ACOCQ4_02080, partial [bacterium]